MLKPVVLYLICPPVIMIGTANAGCYYDVMAKQKTMETVRKFIYFMQCKARLASIGREADGGSACRAYVAYTQSIGDDLVLDAYRDRTVVDLSDGALYAHGIR